MRNSAAASGSRARLVMVCAMVISASLRIEAVEFGRGQTMAMSRSTSRVITAASRSALFLKRS